jgi:hypothetical protein
MIEKRQRRGFLHRSSLQTISNEEVKIDVVDRRTWLIQIRLGRETTFKRRIQHKDKKEVEKEITDAENLEELK